MGIGMSVLCFVFLVILGLALWANATRVGFLMLALLTVMFGAVVGEKPWEGRVPTQIEDFAKRLEAGVIYQFVGSAESDFGIVVLVKETGTSDLRAIRVRGAPPEYFILVDGLPVEVAAPPDADE